MIKWRKRANNNNTVGTLQVTYCYILVGFCKYDWKKYQSCGKDQLNRNNQTKINANYLWLRTCILAQKKPPLRSGANGTWMTRQDMSWKPHIVPCWWDVSVQSVGDICYLWRRTCEGVPVGIFSGPVRCLALPTIRAPVSLNVVAPFVPFGSERRENPVRNCQVSKPTNQ